MLTLTPSLPLTLITSVGPDGATKLVIRVTNAEGVRYPGRIHDRADKEVDVAFAIEASSGNRKTPGRSLEYQGPRKLECHTGSVRHKTRGP